MFHKGELSIQSLRIVKYYCKNSIEIFSKNKGQGIKDMVRVINKQEIILEVMSRQTRKLLKWRI